MIRKASYVLLLLLPLICGAVERISLSVDTISGDDWRLHGVRIGLGEITAPQQTLTLHIEKMLLPTPFDRFSLVDIQCRQLQLDDDQIHCLQGTGIVKSSWLDAAKIKFSFRYSDQQKSIQVGNVKIAGGTVDVSARLNQAHWTLKLKGRALNPRKIAKILAFTAVDVGSGRINVRVDAELDDSGLAKLQLDAGLAGIALQTQDGRYASEDLAATVKLNARRGRRQWYFNNDTRVTQGAVYIEPVYVEVNDQPIELQAKGTWQNNGSRLELSEMAVKHRGLGTVDGHLVLNTGKTVAVDRAELLLKTRNLKALTTTYVQPFLEETAMQGLGFSGALEARLAIVQQTLTDVGIKLSGVDISDERGRVGLTGGQGTINWTLQRSSQSQSQIAWNELQLFDIPVAASELSLTTDAGSYELNQRAELPVLEGVVNIEHFSWYKREHQEPDVHFAGGVDGVSMQQLSTALDWHPFSGTLTGTIPGVNYSQGQLNIKGELDAKLFDGGIRIKKLASKGLFGDLPQVYAEIEIDNLDLHQLTGAFDFGGMEGRLSGYVRDLYLENWQPVTFNAWLGTPEDDDSRHRISQKAVKNITSIGGGGAASLLSRSFLRFFDNFGYDRLGIGCQLQKGVCQLKGVVETEKGYTIVKGGGLPRIDVIGYNPRVDWSVLMQRLKRVTGSDTVVIE